jgi:FkbM family methyltransferase
MRGRNDVLDRLLEVLPALAGFHAPGSPVYEFLDTAARAPIERRFGPGSNGAAHPFGPFGSLAFPYYSMGDIASVDLFGLDELILFSFYWANRARYRRVLDVGANVGLHSIVLERCGLEVRAFEPDPQHFTRLEENLALNGCDRVARSNAAVSSANGEAEFVRVLGNTTSSHLAGSKPNPYGALERFPVPLVAIGPLMAWADLVKLDAEGHELQIVAATDTGDWIGTDMILEVGSAANARGILEHGRRLGLSLFAQKVGWRAATDVEEVPGSYREGSLFISARSEGPWWSVTSR